MHRLFVFIYTIMVLTACTAPKTPQEVTQAFWKAVIEGDAEDAAQYSTLAHSDHFDGFKVEWKNYHPTWGKVIIDGDEAMVESTFESPANSGLENRSFTTYLTRREEVWLVDYDRTAASMTGGAFGDLLDTFDQFGRSLSQQFNETKEEAQIQLDALLKKLEEAQVELSNKGLKTLEEYTKHLRSTLQELEQSIQKALEENKAKLPKKDQQTLKSAASDLQDSQNSLNDNSLDSAIANTQNLLVTFEEISSIDDESLAEYKKQWERLIEQYSKEWEQALKD